MQWDYRLDIGGLTDVGMRRSNNQDSFRILVAPSPEQWRSRGHIFVVADGMGAHAVGELASKMAVDSIPHSYHKLTNLSCAQAIRKAVEDANSSIHSRGAANREFEGMGTTSTALLLLPEGALVAHLGDSRAYRIRNGLIEQLSFDHSLAWELVRRKQLTFDQARSMVPTNVITRSLGPEPMVEVDVEGPHKVQPGDVFVLCSDGLSGLVSDAEIGLMTGSLPAQEACQNLVDMANLRGGPDNITVIVVRVEDPAKADSSHLSARTEARPTTPRDYPTWCVLLGMLGLGVCFTLQIGATFWLKSPNSISIAGPLAIGLAGLTSISAGVVWKRLQRQPLVEETSATRETPQRAPTPCALDKASLSRFASRLNQLRATAVELAWTVEWAQFFAHRHAADKSLAEGNPTAALSEFCKSQHLLAIGQRRHLEQTHSLLGGG